MELLVCDYKVVQIAAIMHTFRDWTSRKNRISWWQEHFFRRKSWREASCIMRCCSTN